MPATLEFTTRAVVEFAIIKGVRSIGLDHKIGSLEPGKKADIIFIRNKGRNIQFIHNLVIAIRNLEMSNRSLWKGKLSKEMADL